MLSMPPASTREASPSRIILRRVHDRLDPGAAQPVDEQRGHLDGHARLEADVARRVDRVGARLHHVTEDHVVDPAGLHARPFETRPSRQ